jgi:ribosomal protein L37AE/L43A
MSAETSHATRQSVLYCPYCAEETLFPLEGGGWECRSCMRAFSVTFLGLSSRSHSGGASGTSRQESA